MYVRSDCGSEDSAWSSSVSFTTFCNAISSFPYVQDFDGTWSGSPAAPECWAVVNNDGGSTWTRASTYITPRSGSWTAHGMGNQDDYLITPAFEIPAGENYEIFWYDIVEGAAQNNTYDVLVSTANTDITSFTDNLGTFDTTNTSWEERNLNLSAYAGQTIYIAFHQTYSASTFWGFGLDDFSISEIPSCITPENLAVSNITATSVDLNWDTETTATSGYDYFVTSDGTVPDASTTPTGNVASGTTTASLSSLTANTEYEVYVRSDCGSGDVSDWSSAVNFKTYGNCASTGSFDYLDNSNEANSVGFIANTSGDYITLEFTAGSTESCCDDWYIKDAADGSGNTIATGSGSIVGSYESTTGEISFYVDSDGSVQGTTFQYELSCSAPPSCLTPTNLTANSPYGLAADFSWDASASETDGYEWVIMADGETADVASAEDTGTVGTGVLSASSTDLSADSDYDLYVRTDCGTSDGKSDWSDKVDFSTGAACPNAEGLAVTNITATSADLEWNQSPNPTANDHFWKIVESGGNPSLPADVIDEGIVAYGNPMTASTSLLDSNTAYDFYVRIACASGGFSIGNGTPVSFTTLCEAVSSFPYTQDFDGTWSGSPAAPDCWAVVNNDGGSTWTRASTYITPRSGSWTAHGMGNQDDYLITPAFEIPAGENYEIFWYDIVESSTRNNTYDVLVSTTNTDITSFTDNLGTFDTTNTTWQERNLNLSAYAGQTIYIAFHQTYSDSSSWGFGLDDFSISEIPSCVTPENLAVSNITATSAEIDWDAETTATGGYDYFVTSDGTLPDGSTTPTGSVDSGTLTVNLTSLTADTDYDVYVRSDCGGENSDWSSAVSFSTPLVVASPWTEDFDVAGQNGWDLTGWNRGTTTTSGGIEGRDGSAVIRKNLYGTGANENGFIETVNIGSIQAGDYLSYEYRLKDFLTPNDALPDAACTFTVTGNFSSSGSVTLQTFSSDDKLGWQKKYIDLSDYVGETVQINIAATRNAEDFWLFFDNFAIKNIDGYVYVNDTTGWLYEFGSANPGDSSADNFEVVEGAASFTSDVYANNLTVFAQASLDVEDVLDLSGGLYTDGDVTFKSTAAKTAQLASGVILSGEVTVERYIPAGVANNRAYRFVTSAVDAGSIYNNWQEGGNSPSGFGTHITGSDTGANGFDQTSTGNPSMFSFNNAAASQTGGAAWTEMPNTDATNLEAGMPYRLFIRGDRTIDLSSNDPTPKNTVLRAKGSLKTGTVPAVDLATGDGQFSFIGNPYQAVVNFNNLLVNGDVNNNYIYAWDANSSDNGAFVTVELPAGTNPASNLNVNNFLQPGQAVFIRNNATVTTAGSIDFTEASKNTSAIQLSPFSDEELTKVDFQLFTTAAFANNSNPSDAIGLRFDENYSIDVNDADAGKLGNSGENLAIVQDNQVLSIEQRTFPVGEESIQLFVNNYQHEDYVFKAIAQNLPEGKAVFVKDNYLDTVTEMNIENGYAFSIDPSIPESTSIFRFELVFENETLGINNYLSDAVSLYPVPVEDILYIANSLNADLSLEVYNMLGQQVAKRNLAAGQDQNISMQGLESGVYIVKISDGEAVYNQQIIKK